MIIKTISIRSSSGSASVVDNGGVVVVAIMVVVVVAVVVVVQGIVLTMELFSSRWNMIAKVREVFIGFFLNLTD